MSETPISCPRFADWLAAEVGAAASKGERSRHALKVAAAEVLGEGGIDALSMGTLADRAGLTRTAFYKHFPTLPELLHELLADFQRCLSEALRSDGRAGNLADAVRATNLAYVRFFAANARTIASVQQLRRNSHDAEAMQFDMNDWWARKIAQTVHWSAGGGRQNGSRLALATACALEAMVDGLLTELYVRCNPSLVNLNLGETEVAEVLTQAWLGALQGPQAASPPSAVSGRRLRPSVPRRPPSAPGSRRR